MSQGSSPVRASWLEDVSGLSEPADVPAVPDVPVSVLVPDDAVESVVPEVGGVSDSPSLVVSVGVACEPWAVVSGNGSLYWSSPAPWANAGAGAMSAHASTPARRRRVSGVAWSFRGISVVVFGAVRRHPSRWRGRDSPQVAGLAVASLTANALAIVFTVVFARVLGEEDYGSLAALTSWLLILGVPGSALQVASARDVAAGRYGDGPRLAAVTRRWLRPVILAAVVLSIVSALLRVPLAEITGVDEVWAAALVLPGACAWFALCLLRGVLQGDGAIAAVGWSIAGEAAGRVVCGLLLLSLGTGVVGAFAGTPLSFTVATLALLVVLRRRVGRPETAADDDAAGLDRLAAGAWSAIIALTLLMMLQSLDVIVAKHQLPDDEAGSYTAAAVAAKVLIWVAIGLAVYVVPEASRRAARGAAPFGALAQALGAIAVLAVPVLTIFLVAPELLLRLGFGIDYEDAAPALLPLGTAMTLLACCYLSSQYLLALRHWSFLVVLVTAVIAELAGLLAYGDSYRSFALVALAVQSAGVLAILGLAARAAPRGTVAEVPV